MIVSIRLTQFSILAIFIISLLLCIGISSITTTDPIDDNSVPSRTDSTDGNNQTVPSANPTPLLNENVVPETNTQFQSTEIPPIIENETPTTTDQSELVDEVVSTTAAPLVTESPLHDEPSVTTTPTTTTIKKNLSSINSFEEWKQQQLHADLLTKGEIASRNSVSPDTAFANAAKSASSTTNIQQNPSSNNLNKKGKLRKNFASASCGAKILAHNIEAQNVGSVLSSSPDEYMLNPCNVKIWFVIELCESIRILNIEIANFELFSSVPKTFRVSASDRYPTKDWHRHHLGTFNASFNRTIQSFQTTESTTYLKYVKFELLDFHGHEHYCPLSVVRLHGSNVEDEIMTMEDNTNLVESKSISNMEGENDDDSTDDEDLANDQQVGGIIGSAILDLAKRVFRRQTIRGTSSTTSSPVIVTNGLKSDCHQAVLNGSMTNETIYMWRRNETFKECIAKFLVGLWARFDTCTAYLSQICFKINYCCQCPVTMNNRTKTKRLTLNIYNNPCGYYHILTSQFVCTKEKLIPLNQTILTKINGDLVQDLMEKTLPVDQNETGTVITENGGNSFDSQSALNLSESILDEIPHESTTNRSGDLSPAQNVSNETLTVSESSDMLETINETAPLSSSSSSSSISESVPENFTVTEPPIDTNNIEETSTTTATPSTLNTPNGNEVMPPIISSPWLKGMLVNTKSLPELFKIIEKLSFNLTLSNRYLQELSQHYVKKIDETQETTDLLLISSKHANEKLENLEEQFYQLQGNFNELSNRLIKLEAWIPLIVCSIMCLFIWCLWSTCRLSLLRRKYQDLVDEFEQIKIQQQVKNHDESEDDDEDENESDDRPIVCNGYNKRKLSTDSSDSNPTRSQRVPDLSLSKIVENGTGKIDHQFQEKSSKRTEQFPLLTAI